MSVRAYRINSFNEKSSFNTWHDEKLMDLLEKCNCDFYGNDGESVFISVEPKILKKAIKEIEYLDEDVKKQLKEDIKWAKETKEDWLYYMCY